MKIQHIVLLLALVVLVGCVQQDTTPGIAPEQPVQPQATNQHTGMPCHQMPDGSWMGDCDEGMIHDHAHVVHSELEFIVEMIPHHQEAIDSSIELLALNPENEAVVELAQNIIAEQEREIALMESWLDNWYEGQRYAPMYMPMMRNLQGMPSDQAVTIYLEDMIHHHEMAVVMAQSVLELSPREEVVTMANEIIAVQNQEIELMENLLE